MKAYDQIASWVHSTRLFQKLKRKKCFQTHCMRLTLPWYQNQTLLKKELQDNISDEYRCRYSQQHTSKPHSTVH